MQEIIAKGFLSSYYVAKTVTERVYDDILAFDVNNHYVPSNFVVGVLCEESSSRTRFSTESAVQKLGGSVIHFSSLEETSVSKGESLRESAELWSNYFDLLAIRSKKEYLPFIFSKYASIPVINLGDGANEHPSQGLATLVHAHKVFGRIEGINICLWGDFLKSRTAHSVAISFSALGANVIVCSVPKLDKNNPTIGNIMRHYPNSRISIVDTISEIKDKVDVFYITRLQKERWDIAPEYKVFSPSYCEKLSEDGIILHSLPHNEEIEETVLFHKKSRIHDHIKITQKTRAWLIYQYKTAHDAKEQLSDNTSFYEEVWYSAY